MINDFKATLSVFKLSKVFKFQINTIFKENCEFRKYLGTCFIGTNVIKYINDAETLKFRLLNHRRLSFERHHKFQSWIA